MFCTSLWNCLKEEQVVAVKVIALFYSGLFNMIVIFDLPPLNNRETKTKVILIPRCAPLWIFLEVTHWCPVEIAATTLTITFCLCSLLAILALCHCRLRAVPHLHPVPGWCADYSDALMGWNAHIKIFVVEGKTIQLLHAHVMSVTLHARLPRVFHSNRQNSHSDESGKFLEVHVDFWFNSWIGSYIQKSLVVENLKAS